MAYDDTDDVSYDARQQRMAAMLGILSGNKGLSDFGKSIIANQDQQQGGQLQGLSDAIGQNLRLGSLVQSGQEHHDTLLEAMRYHNMEDQERRDKLAQQKSQQSDLDSAQSTIDAIGQYKLPLPTNRSARNAAIIDEVSRQYPDYDATKYSEKKAAQTGFASGKQGDLVRSADVSVAHLDTADQLAAGLHNTSIPAVNSLVNFYKTQTGSPDIANFNAAKQIVSGEINKFIVGGHAAEGDRERLLQQLDSASSPDQLNGVTNTLRTLMGGQLKGLQGQFVSSGLGSEDDFLKKLQPRTIGALGLAETQQGRAASPNGTPAMGSGPQQSAPGIGQGVAPTARFGGGAGPQPMRVRVDANGNVIGN